MFKDKSAELGFSKVLPLLTPNSTYSSLIIRREKRLRKKREKGKDTEKRRRRRKARKKERETEGKNPCFCDEIAASETISSYVVISCRFSPRSRWRKQEMV